VIKNHLSSRIKEVIETLWPSRKLTPFEESRTIVENFRLLERRIARSDVSSRSQHRILRCPAGIMANDACKVEGTLLLRFLATAPRSRPSVCGRIVGRKIGIFPGLIPSPSISPPSDPPLFLRRVRSSLTCAIFTRSQSNNVCEEGFENKLLSCLSSKGSTKRSGDPRAT